MTGCAIKGCGSEAAIGTRLCEQHLSQVDAVYAEISEIDEAESDDPYELAVREYSRAVSQSDQMRGLTLALVEGGVRDAPESFPKLKALPKELVEQLSAFMAVSVVSAVIQERAHMLARARILASALPKEKAEGLEIMIEEELKSLKIGEPEM